MNKQTVITTVHPKQAGFTFGRNTLTETTYLHCGQTAYCRTHWQQESDGIWHSQTVVKCRKCGLTNITSRQEANHV